MGCPGPGVGIKLIPDSHQGAEMQGSSVVPESGGRRLVVALVAATLGLAACGSAAPHSVGKGAAPSARPGGPFAVGRRTVTFVDPSRPTPPNGNVPESPHRALEVIIEYPTAGTADPAHESADATPLPGRHPTVIYVHGFGAHADNPYLHPWAAAGFIAVAPTFPLTNADAPGGPNRSDLVNEPADVSFVIGQLLRSSTANKELAHAIDRHAFGVMGASGGAAVVDQLIADPQVIDRRIRAAIEQSCGCPPHPYPNQTPPLMFMHGTADPVASYDWTAQSFGLASSPKYFLTLQGAQHIQYDEPWLSISARASRDFFDAYLGHKPKALQRLTVDGNVANVASLQSR
jgi:predicted esterase